jgi:protein-S-isoprenylcysteine O-methyltransferase Ste14
MGVATVALGLALHLWVVVREEPALRRRFGEVYDAYTAHVPRWIPRARDTDSTGVRG